MSRASPYCSHSPRGSSGSTCASAGAWLGACDGHLPPILRFSRPKKPSMEGIIVTNSHIWVMTAVVRYRTGSAPRGRRVPDQAHDHQQDSGDDERPSADVDQVVGGRRQSAHQRGTSAGDFEDGARPIPTYIP